MGRKRIIKTVEEFDASNPHPTLPDDGQPEGLETLEDAEGIQQYLSQFGPTPFRVKVYKNGPEGPAYCFAGSQDVDEEKIRAYGGGDYELRVFVNGVKQDTVHVKIAERPSAMQPQQVQQSSGSSDNFELRMMREQLEFFKSMLLQNRSNSTPIGELVEAVRAVNGLGGGNSTSNSIDALMKGIELAKELGAGGSGDWKSALIDAIKELGKNVAPMLAQAKGVEVPVTMEDMLKQGIVELKQKAISGMPPSLVIEWVMYQANNPQYQPFIQTVLQREFDTFIQLDAELANEPYATWFRTLHSGLRDAFNESLNNDDSTGETGNVRDITSHGSSGKASKSK